MASRNLENVCVIVGEGVKLMCNKSMSDLSPSVRYKNIIVAEKSIKAPVFEVGGTKLAFYETDTDFMCQVPECGASMRLASKRTDEGTCRLFYNFAYLEADREEVPRTAILSVIKLARCFSQA